ncbi:MAG: PLP-dependent aminotransferase family protein [Clostridiales Family XIII bacterium]|jgi:GntR family transcriptional regulator/MocR family aminotransferase|nr:PLP-dependent aminotransferase family protein [Clostridiales Family XIII bacterium]
MFTVLFSDRKDRPLYEQLYAFIKHDIEIGVLKADEKLPSQRKLAAHLNISRFTVENAYAQLISEGYVVPVEKQGYYVSTIEPIERGKTPMAAVPIKYIEDEEEKIAESIALPFDLRTNTIGTEHFPYSVWSRLMRTNMRIDPSRLLSTVHPQGDEGLRSEIAIHLYKFRGMNVAADQIVIGAGTEYLMGLITEILPGASFGVEDPGYPKIPRILESRRAKVYPVPLDKEGMRVDSLARTDADVAVITPSHQFPLGVVMSIGRRQALLRWANEANERYLIEDDYNSEFHFGLKPIPTLYDLDQNSKVVYLNSFANTLAPSLRIAYMVLPRELLERYRKTLYFYSCTVSAFEQHTLRLFMQEGYYERHVNRMRKIYRNRQAVLIEGLSPLGGRLQIDGQSAGLHLLLRISDMSEDDLVTAAANHGVSVVPISGFFVVPENRDTHTVVAGFSGCRRDILRQAAAALSKAWG